MRTRIVMFGRRLPRRMSFAALVLVAAVLAVPSPAEARTTYVVNAADDTVDELGCDTVHCSLREAIEAANRSGGEDTIAFDIPGRGLQTISPLSALPDLTDAVILDGTTQPGR